MKTKAQIVGELLKDGKINAEDAVVLLTPEYINTYPNPYYQPYYYGGTNNPILTYCGTGGVITGTTANTCLNITDN